MSVRKCPKCGSVWYTPLVNCAFCGIEGEEVKGPISPAKLNLVHGSVSSTPPEAKEPAPPPPPPSVAPEAPPAPPTPKEAPVAETAAPRIETPEPPPPVPDKPARLPEIVNAPERRLPLRTLPKVDAATAAAPRIPSAVVPLVFAGLGIVACTILPLMATFLRDRVTAIMALLAFAILSPFAPFAWLAGQRYVDQCRLLGFAPAAGANSGKVLGMLGSFLLVFEISALSLFVVIQGLSGKVSCPLWK